MKHETLNRTTVRFHDETPEIASLYLTSPQDDPFGYSHISTVDATAEEREEEHTPATRHTQQDHVRDDLSQLPLDSIAEDFSPWGRSVHSSASSRTGPLYTFTEREAVLIRNFVENMALWVRSSSECR